MPIATEGAVAKKEQQLRRDIEDRFLPIENNIRTLVEHVENLQNALIEQAIAIKPYEIRLEMIHLIATYEKERRNRGYDGT